MPKSLRQQLLKDYGVPESTLRRFVLEVESKVQSKFEGRFAALEKQLNRLEESESVWRKKYFKAEKARQDFEFLIAIKDEKISELEAKIEKQSAEISKLREEIFAASSERQASSEPENTSNTAPEQTPKAGKRKRGKQPGSKGHGRRTEQDLERRPERHRLASTECPLCGLECRSCPPEKSDEIDIDEKVFVREHYREKVQRVCRCPNESVPRFAIAEAPKKLITNGKYSARFWRFVMEEKFLLQRPVTRIVTKLQFMGLKKISSGVITNGLRLIYELKIFEVMYLAIIDHNRVAGQWNIDDTGWKVFSEASSHWHMWVSVSVDTCVYALDPERSNRVVGKLLKGVTQGVICADRHSSFKAFAKRNDGFVIAFCWSHQRRDFIEMQTGYAELSDWCQSWLDRINALFHQNNVRVSQLDNPEQFKAEDAILRQMISGMEKEMRKQMRRKGLHTEQLARLTSLQEHWSGLTVFVDQPLVPMDNNAAERALRNLVVGRKIYYGSRAAWSGNLLAQLSTIFATLERNGVDARQWMDDYMAACAANGGNPPKNLHPFLPWSYKPSSSIQTTPESNSEPITVSLLQQEIQAIPGHT